MEKVALEFKQKFSVLGQADLRTTTTELLNYLYLIQEKDVRTGRCFLHWLTDYKVSLVWVERVFELNPSAIKAVDNQGNLPIHLALRKKFVNLKVVTFLLEKYPESATVCNSLGYNLLHYSVIGENTFAITKRLVESFYNQGLLVTARERSILHEAIIASAPIETIRYIIEQYPDLVKTEDIYGRLPIFYILVKENYLPLHYLLETTSVTQESGYYSSDRVLVKFIAGHHGENVYSVCDEDGLTTMDRDEIMKTFFDEAHKLLLQELFPDFKEKVHTDLLLLLLESYPECVNIEMDIAASFCGSYAQYLLERMDFNVTFEPLVQLLITTSSSENCFAPLEKLLIQIANFKNDETISDPLISAAWQRVHSILSNHPYLIWCKPLDHSNNTFDYLLSILVQCQPSPDIIKLIISELSLSKYDQDDKPQVAIIIAIQAGCDESTFELLLNQFYTGGDSEISAFDEIDLQLIDVVLANSPTPSRLHVFFDHSYVQPRINNKASQVSLLRLALKYKLSWDIIGYLFDLRREGEVIQRDRAGNSILHYLLLDDGRIPRGTKVKTFPQGNWTYQVVSECLGLYKVVHFRSYDDDDDYDDFKEQELKVVDADVLTTFKPRVSISNGSEAFLVEFLTYLLQHNLDTMFTEELGCRGVLPLHAAAKGNASAVVLENFLKGHPPAAQMLIENEPGTYPLNLLLENHGCSVSLESVQLLVMSHPQAVISDMTANAKDESPIFVPSYIMKYHREFSKDVVKYIITELCVLLDTIAHTIALKWTIEIFHYAIEAGVSEDILIFLLSLFPSMKTCKEFGNKCLLQVYLIMCAETQQSTSPSVVMLLLNENAHLITEGYDSTDGKDHKLALLYLLIAAKVDKTVLLHVLVLFPGACQVKMMHCNGAYPLQVYLQQLNLDLEVVQLMLSYCPQAINEMNFENDQRVMHFLLAHSVGEDIIMHFVKHFPNICEQCVGRDRSVLEFAIEMDYLSVDVLVAICDAFPKALDFPFWAPPGAVFGAYEKAEALLTQPTPLSLVKRVCSKSRCQQNWELVKHVVKLRPSILKEHFCHKGSFEFTYGESSYYLASFSKSCDHILHTFIRTPAPLEMFEWLFAQDPEYFRSCKMLSLLGEDFLSTMDIAGKMSPSLSKDCMTFLYEQFSEWLDQSSKIDIVNDSGQDLYVAVDSLLKALKGITVPENIKSHQDWVLANRNNDIESPATPLDEAAHPTECSNDGVTEAANQDEIDIINPQSEWMYIMNFTVQRVLTYKEFLENSEVINNKADEIRNVTTSTTIADKMETIHFAASVVEQFLEQFERSLEAVPSWEKYFITQLRLAFQWHVPVSIIKKMLELKPISFIGESSDSFNPLEAGCDNAYPLSFLQYLIGLYPMQDELSMRFTDISCNAYKLEQHLISVSSTSTSTFCESVCFVLKQWLIIVFDSPLVHWLEEQVQKDDSEDVKSLTRRIEQIQEWRSSFSCFWKVLRDWPKNESLVEVMVLIFRYYPTYVKDLLPSSFNNQYDQQYLFHVVCKYAEEHGYHEPLLHAILDHSNSDKTLSQRDSYGNTPLIYLLIMGSIRKPSSEEAGFMWSVFDRVVKAYPKACNTRCSEGYLPLHIALRHGASFEVIQLLIENSDDNDICSKRRWSHEVVAKRNEEFLSTIPTSMTNESRIIYGDFEYYNQRLDLNDSAVYNRAKEVAYSYDDGRLSFDSRNVLKSFFEREKQMNESVAAAISTMSACELTPSDDNIIIDVGVLGTLPLHFASVHDEIIISLLIEKYPQGCNEKFSNGDEGEAAAANDVDIEWLPLHRAIYCQAPITVLRSFLRIGCCEEDLLTAFKMSLECGPDMRGFMRELITSVLEGSSLQREGLLQYVGFSKKLFVTPIMGLINGDDEYDIMIDVSFLVDLLSYGSMIKDTNGYGEELSYIWHPLIDGSSSFFTTTSKEHLVRYVLKCIPQHARALAFSVDIRGRCARDIVPPSVQSLLDEELLFLGKYELTSLQYPLHRSKTSLIVKAVAHSSGRTTTVENAATETETETESKASKGYKSKSHTEDVVLKFMAYEDQFFRELQSRSLHLHAVKSDNNQLLAVDPQKVIMIKNHYHPDQYPNLQAAIANLHLVGSHNKEDRSSCYSYVVVMEAGDRNLKAILDSERIAGHNEDAIYTAALQIGKAVQHLHEHGIVHGDLKPSNVVRSNGIFKLIDLDAAVKFAPVNEMATHLLHESVGMKFSTAYIPPEMVLKAFNHQTGDTEYLIRQPLSSAQSRELLVLAEVNKALYTFTLLDEDLTKHSSLLASPAYDMWSFGCILFQLFTNEPLWRANGDDNIDQEQLEHIHQWGMGNELTSLYQTRLNKVTHPLQRNLLSLLLHRDPSRRPQSMHHVLAHPYFSKNKSGRLLGETAPYDIFLSYRVDSDAFLTSLFYEELTQRGIKVWWDQKCLKSGLNWEEGFCDGLVNSAVFIPLLSRLAIKERFENLSESSYCDNVLLEHRLALELQARGYIDRVFPIFVGDYLPAVVDGENAAFSNYFRTGCHPSLTSSNVVLSVENKLQYHLDLNSLGSPYFSPMVVKDILDKLTMNQGAFLMGNSSTCIGGDAGTSNCSSRPTSATMKISADVLKARLQKELVKHICDSIEKMIVEMKVTTSVVTTVVKSAVVKNNDESTSASEGGAIISNLETATILRLQREEILRLRQVIKGLSVETN